MIFKSERSERPFRMQYPITDLTSDHQARLAREQAEAQQRRSEALAGQVSMTNNASERIRIWEDFHGLSMPVTPTHKLLEVIAAATDLQLEQVQEVQRQRTSPAPGISVGALSVEKV